MKQTRDWWLHARIGKELDHRRKVTDQDKKDILHLYNIDKLSIRQIAREYERVCSRRLIQFIIFPNRYIEMLKKQKEQKHWKKYYTKESRKQYMKTHRNNIRKKYDIPTKN